MPQTLFLPTVTLARQWFKPPEDVCPAVVSVQKTSTVWGQWRRWLTGGWERQTRPDGKNTRPSAGNKTCESSGWLWLIIKSTSFKQNYVEMLKYASGFLHVISLRMNAHPPLLVPCSERRQAGEVGGRATPSPFLSVSGARRQLLREAWSCCPWLSRAEPRPYPGRLSEEVMRAHGRELGEPEI